MATLAEILASKPGAPRPWDEGQGVVPDQPVQRIDPAALAASANMPPAEGMPIGSIADDPMARAAQLSERQGAAAQLGAPQSQAFQQTPLNWMALGAMLGQLLQKGGK